MERGSLTRHRVDLAGNCSSTAYRRAAIGGLGSDLRPWHGGHGRKRGRRASAGIDPPGWGAAGFLRREVCRREQFGMWHT